MENKKRMQIKKYYSKEVLLLSAGKPNIKAVTFDVWETLLLERDGWNLRRTTAVAKALNTP